MLLLVLYPIVTAGTKSVSSKIYVLSLSGLNCSQNKKGKMKCVLCVNKPLLCE